MNGTRLALLLAFSVTALAPPGQTASAAEAAKARPGPAEASKAAPKAAEAGRPAPKAPAPGAAGASAPPAPAAPPADAPAPLVSEQHIAAGLECASCHGPEETKRPVEGDKCLECHTSFEEVAKRTTGLKPNPHANHYVDTGVAECVGCHLGHQPRTLLCTECHTVRFERSPAAAP